MVLDPPDTLHVLIISQPEADVRNNSGSSRGFIHILALIQASDDLILDVLFVAGCSPEDGIRCNLRCSSRFVDDQITIEPDMYGGGRTFE
jgi:hypothetical protein